MKLLRKSTIFPLVGILLLFGAWELFRQWKPTPDTGKLIRQYHSYQDSLRGVEFALRQNPDAAMLHLQKERGDYFRKKIESLRTDIEQKTPAKKSENAELGLLADNLRNALGWTLGLLLLLIFVLTILLKRKKRIPPVLEKNVPDVAAFDQKTLTSLLENIRPPTETLQEPTARKSSSEEEGFTVARSDNRPIIQAVPHLPEERVSATPDTRPVSVIREKKAPVEAPRESRFEKEDAEREEVLKLAKRGYTSSEIARRLRLSQDQVDLTLRLARDRE